MNDQTPNKPVNLARRRLTQGGMASPIILATLASKNALAAPAYRATISGQLSGNYSPVPRQGQDNVVQTYAPTIADLQSNGGNNSHWGAVNRDASFVSIFQRAGGTTYSVVHVQEDKNPTLPIGAGNSRKDWENDAKKKVSTYIAGNPGKPASFIEVMTLPISPTNPPAGDPDLTLGRMAIAMYVGYVKHGADFPLTLPQIREMFESAVRNVNYYYPNTAAPIAQLSREEVVSYWNFLSTGVPPTLNPLP